MDDTPEDLAVDLLGRLMNKSHPQAIHRRDRTKVVAAIFRRIADLELELARQQAANSVHMQTLAMVAMWERVVVMNGQEFAKRRKAAADEAAASVRPEHLVRVQVNARS